MLALSFQRSGARFGKQALVTYAFRPQHSSPRLCSRCLGSKTPPGLSYPLLHRVFVVGDVLLNVFVLKLEDCVYEDQNAQ